MGIVTGGIVHGASGDSAVKQAGGYLVRNSSRLSNWLATSVQDASSETSSARIRRRLAHPGQQDRGIAIGAEMGRKRWREAASTRCSRSEGARPSVVVARKANRAFSSDAPCRARSASLRAASTHCTSLRVTKACSGVLLRPDASRRPARARDCQRSPCSEAARRASRTCTCSSDTDPPRCPVRRFWCWPPASPPPPTCRRADRASPGARPRAPRAGRTRRGRRRAAFRHPCGSAGPGRAAGWPDPGSGAPE
jgi:hypothetical protein